MSVPAKLAAFAATLVVAGALGAGLGTAIGPLGPTAPAHDVPSHEVPRPEAPPGGAPVGRDGGDGDHGPTHGDPDGPRPLDGDGRSPDPGAPTPGEG